MKLTFHSPEYFYLLLGLIPLLGLSLWSYYSRRHKLRAYAGRQAYRLMPERIGIKRLLKDLLLCLAAIVAIVALARPQMPSGVSSEEDRQGIEAMICVDVSNSMLCPDLPPSRLEFTKRTLQTLLSRMKYDKVGIVIFAARAYVHLPMTTDLKTAQEFIADINANMLSAQGTAIGEAITLARTAFSTTREIGKTIIVLTDGENHEGDAIASAADAKKAGIKVQVVGIGTKEGGPIPISGASDYLKDERGELVTTHFSPSMCRDIAEAGGGAFITSTSQSTIVNALTEQLDGLPKASTGQHSGRSFTEYYQILAWLTLLFLLWELLMSERKNKLFSKTLFDDDDQAA